MFVFRTISVDSLSKSHEKNMKVVTNVNPDQPYWKVYRALKLFSDTMVWLAVMMAFFFP